MEDEVKPIDLSEEDFGAMEDPGTENICTSCE